MLAAPKWKDRTAEILIVGNELLNGTTLDTNSHWLSIELENIGLAVTRKTTITDNQKIISSAFKEALSRRPSLIFSIGGMGPTFDDMTLLGLARALNKRILRNRTAVQFLRESYIRRHGSAPRLSRASLKMAEIPDGSLPLPNPVGSAPAVVTQFGSSKVISLPGVPEELKGIFREQILPLLVSDFPGLIKKRQIWLRSIGIGESQIAASTRKIMRKYSPNIYLKSHALGFDKKGRSLLLFQLISLNPHSDASLGAATLALERAIAKLGGKIQRRKGTRANQ
jgi:nicotinamide-nucleotide amidase